jgi:hypothetical protein
LAPTISPRPGYPAGRGPRSGTDELAGVICGSTATIGPIVLGGGQLVGKDPTGSESDAGRWLPVDMPVMQFAGLADGDHRALLLIRLDIM